MPVCPYCSSSDVTRDGHNQRGCVRACRACGRHGTSESTSLMAGHRFPRDIILLAVRYYLQLGAALEVVDILTLNIPAAIFLNRGILTDIYDAPSASSPLVERQAKLPVNV